MVRNLVVQLIYLGLNLICVLYLRLIILSVGDNVFIDNETLLMTDFVNLKIKSTQSFKVIHRGRMHVRVFIEMSNRTCINICVLYCASQQKKKSEPEECSLRLTWGVHCKTEIKLAV
jgi:hypothetical protein